MERPGRLGMAQDGAGGTQRRFGLETAADTCSIRQATRAMRRAVVAHLEPTVGEPQRARPDVSVPLACIVVQGSARTIKFSTELLGPDNLRQPKAQHNEGFQLCGSRGKCICIRPTIQIYSANNQTQYTISGSEARPLPEWLIRQRKRCANVPSPPPPGPS
jgi:hypothetical protein